MNEAEAAVRFHLVSWIAAVTTAGIGLYALGWKASPFVIAALLVGIRTDIRPARLLWSVGGRLGELVLIAVSTFTLGLPETVLLLSVAMLCTAAIWADPNTGPYVICWLAALADTVIVTIVLGTEYMPLLAMIIFVSLVIQSHQNVIFDD